MKLQISLGMCSQAATSRTGISDVQTSQPVNNIATCTDTPESVNSHIKSVEDIRAYSSALALIDLYPSSLRSISHQDHGKIVNDNDLNLNIYVLSSHAYDYMLKYIYITINTLIYV